MPARSRVCRRGGTERASSVAGVRRVLLPCAAAAAAAGWCRVHLCMPCAPAQAHDQTAQRSSSLVTRGAERRAPSADTRSGHSSETTRTQTDPLPAARLGLGQVHRHGRRSAAYATTADRDYTDARRCIAHRANGVARRGIHQTTSALGCMFGPTCTHPHPHPHPHPRTHTRTRARTSRRGARWSSSSGLVRRFFSLQTAPCRTAGCRSARSSDGPPPTPGRSCPTR